MSPREQVQETVFAWLSKQQEHFNAPYGVLAGLHSATRGKVRTVTFGIARTLDATLFIWSPTRLELKSSRNHTPIRFSTIDEFKSYCMAEYGAAR